MAFHVFGKKVVAAAGTPVQVDADGLGRYLGVITVQAKPSNTGKLYVGSTGMVKATGVGVLLELAAGVVGTIGPYQTGMRSDQLFLDVDTNGESGYVSAEVL